MQDDKQRELLRLQIEQMKEKDKISNDKKYEKKVKKRKRIVKLIYILIALLFIYIFIKFLLFDIKKIIEYSL